MPVAIVKEPSQLQSAATKLKGALEGVQESRKLQEDKRRYDEDLRLKQRKQDADEQIATQQLGFQIANLRNLNEQGRLNREQEIKMRQMMDEYGYRTQRNAITSTEKMSAEEIASLEKRHEESMATQRYGIKTQAGVDYTNIRETREARRESAQVDLIRAQAEGAMISKTESVLTPFGGDFTDLTPEEKGEAVDQLVMATRGSDFLSGATGATEADIEAARKEAAGRLTGLPAAKEAYYNALAEQTHIQAEEETYGREAGIYSAAEEYGRPGTTGTTGVKGRDSLQLQDFYKGGKLNKYGQPEIDRNLIERRLGTDAASSLQAVDGIIESSGQEISAYATSQEFNSVGLGLLQRATLYNIYSEIDSMGLPDSVARELKYYYNGQLGMVTGEYETELPENLKLIQTEAAKKER